jgi:redox-sensitive bicupin YhaK (pirin superfamily)
MKEIIHHITGQPEAVGSSTVYRTIPAGDLQAVGSIIFLDHFPDEYLEPREPALPDGSFAHPHRGIATFSYLLEGELHHFDSRGNQGIIDAGGIQWMNSGNGIVHDEHPSLSFQKSGGPMHGFQLWLNLPPEIKAKEPEYRCLKAAEVPEVVISDQARLRVLVGAYKTIESSIPRYTNHFIYHVHLESDAHVVIETAPNLEYGAHLALGQLQVNEREVAAKEMVVFSTVGEDIHLSNTSGKEAGILIFGGEPITDKIVPYGPFVMNSLTEVQQAYRDFEAGKYGTINYFKPNQKE